MRKGMKMATETPESAGGMGDPFARARARRELRRAARLRQAGAGATGDDARDLNDKDLSMAGKNNSGGKADTKAKGPVQAEEDEDEETSTKAKGKKAAEEDEDEDEETGQTKAEGKGDGAGGDKTESKPGAPVAASFAELKAAFGGDPAFVVEAQDKGWTMMQALTERTKRLEAENGKLRQGKDRLGNAGDAGADAVGTDKQAAGGGDYMAEVKRVMAQDKCSKGEAIRKVNKARPDLRKAYVESLRA